MKIITVLGARPQFIKASVVSKQMDQHGINEVMIHTGQHFDANMSNVFFDELEIRRPKYNLEINGKSHGAMTGRMIEEVEKIIILEQPDWVLVYGDTNSTLAGALAASKLHVPIAHVEAGLRSFNKKMPEEINRILTDHVSRKLFVPTEVARKNLLNEGMQSKDISVVGDVMYDVSLYYGEKAKQVSKILKQLNIDKGQYVLTTCHRAENTDHPDRLKAIFEGLQDVSKSMPVVCPLHPRTKKYLESSSWFNPNMNMKIIEPVGYLDMLALEASAAVIATDSGGVQKEAFFYGVPCITLRDETEWVELVESGWNHLTPPISAARVSDSILKAKDTKGESITPYGDGKASQKIVAELLLKA